MDSRLSDRLTKWHDQITAVEKVEHTCMLLEASEKPAWAGFFLSSPGKSVAEREANAYTHPEWKILQEGLVAARVAYNRERRILELKQSAFNAEYLAAKLEGEAVQKYPRSGAG